MRGKTIRVFELSSCLKGPDRTLQKTLKTLWRTAGRPAEHKYCILFKKKRCTDSLESSVCSDEKTITKWVNIFRVFFSTQSC